MSSSQTTSWSRQDPTEIGPHSSNADHHSEVKTTEIRVSRDICSVAFLANGLHVVGGGHGGKVRVWQAADGEEVGTAMDAGSTAILDIATRDGKWVVVGTVNGRVIVWDGERHEKVAEFQAHENWVRAVDLSPDLTKVASGSDDKTVRVWCISTGQQLLQPLEHDDVLAAVKFSPNGDLFATATSSWWTESVRIYNSRDGGLLVDIPIRLNSYVNQSLGWLLTGTFLFALSFDGAIKCFDVPTRSMYSGWSGHPGGINNAKCMVVASNGKFIALAANSLVFFVDTITEKRIGPIVEHTDIINSIDISSNYDLAAGGGRSITIRSLADILPPSYVDYVPCGKKVASDDVDPLGTLVNSMASMALQHTPFIKTAHSYDEQSPNDLTSQIKRDGHDPVTSGGYADIYRGMLQTTWQPIRIAIKAIRTYSADDSNFFKKHKRLRREIKVWLALKHINIVPLLGTTTGFGRFPAMVCPWIENGALTTFLEAYYGNLSSTDILNLLNDTASGLHYLHSCSVVHGDLSGSNVLVCKNKRAYISDFGLSTLLTELGGPTFATSVHERGTLRWTAPELLDLQISEDDEEPSNVMPTKYSDVYSFGGVMLQILTGKIPYYYYTREAQVVHAVSRGMTPRRPGSPAVDERRWMLIQWCWSTVDPSQSRPSSEDIVHFMSNELAGAITP